MVTLVERAKSGRAKCQDCTKTIEKGVVRFGYTTNYRGRLGAAYLHMGCAPNKPAADALPTLDGWAELDADGQRAALAAVGASDETASAVVDGATKEKEEKAQAAEAVTPLFVD